MPQEPRPDEFYLIEPHGKFWAVWENPDQLIFEEGPQEKRLVTLCVYKKGAQEVKRRLTNKVRVRSRHSFWKDKEGARDDEDEDEED